MLAVVSKMMNKTEIAPAFMGSSLVTIDRQMSQYLLGQCVRICKLWMHTEEVPDPVTGSQRRFPGGKNAWLSFQNK